MSMEYLHGGGWGVRVSFQIRRGEGGSPQPGGGGRQLLFHVLEGLVYRYISLLPFGSHLSATRGKC